jgi:hypothetical protein
MPNCPINRCGRPLTDGDEARTNTLNEFLIERGHRPAAEAICIHHQEKRRKDSDTLRTKIEQRRADEGTLLEGVVAKSAGILTSGEFISYYNLSYVLNCDPEVVKMLICMGLLEEGNKSKGAMGHVRARSVPPLMVMIHRWDDHMQACPDWVQNSLMASRFRVNQTIKYLKTRGQRLTEEGGEPDGKVHSR